MSKFKLGESVYFLLTKEETTIIKIVPKGTYNLSEDFYIPECSPNKTYTDKAFKKINKALHPPKRKNECKSGEEKCRWLVDIAEDAFCFLTNQRVYSAIRSDYKPSKCLKGTEEEKLILEKSNEQREEKKKKRS